MIFYGFERQLANNLDAIDESRKGERAIRRPGCGAGCEVY
jgi:hypothetical protein